MAAFDDHSLAQLIGRSKPRSNLKNPGEVKITVEQADSALARFDGDRKRAAEHLNVTLEQLKGKIYQNDALKVKWGKVAKVIRQRVAEAGGDEAAKFNNLTAATYDNLQMMILELQQEIGRIQKRIRQAEEAQFSDDQSVKKYVFKLNVRGEPSEETMLRNALADAREEMRKSTEAIAYGSYLYHKIESMDKASGKGQPSTRGKPGVGFRSKGETYIERQVNVQINAPKSNGTTS